MSINGLEFTIIFPAPPVFFLSMLGILAILVVYWVAKWLISLYTGAGGG
jgi:xanthosine utilization system XapX-like protein